MTCHTAPAYSSRSGLATHRGYLGEEAVLSAAWDCISKRPKTSSEWKFSADATVFDLLTVEPRQRCAEMISSHRRSGPNGALLAGPFRPLPGHCDTYPSNSCQYRRYFTHGDVRMRMPSSVSPRIGHGQRCRWTSTLRHRFSRLLPEKESARVNGLSFSLLRVPTYEARGL
jgi:hypothetical protein